MDIIHDIRNLVVELPNLRFINHEFSTQLDCVRKRVSKPLIMRSIAHFWMSNMTSELSSSNKFFDFFVIYCFNRIFTQLRVGVSGPINNKLILDYRNVFHMMEWFDSHESLIGWVCERALPLDIIILVTCSEIGNEKRWPCLVLACERHEVI